MKNMEVVLIQGRANTGKTTLVRKIEKCLIAAGFKVEKGNGKELRERRPKCGYEQDFTAIYEKGKCRIIINSESESEGIKRLKKMYDDNNKEYDFQVLITAIRPSDNPKLDKGIKDIYKNVSNVNVHIIDLDQEKLESQNQRLDFCKFIMKILRVNGRNIFKDIKEKLGCTIEVNCDLNDDEYKPPCSSQEI